MRERVLVSEDKISLVTKVFYYIYCVYECVWWENACVSRGQVCGIDSFLPSLHGFWGLNSAHWAFAVSDFVHGAISLALQVFFVCFYISSELYNSVPSGSVCVCAHMFNFKYSGSKHPPLFL